jgi:hypothetical protein
MKTAYAPFDAADYLDNGEAIAEYLTATLEDPNPDVFLAALGDAAKARGPRHRSPSPLRNRQCRVTRARGEIHRYR